MKLLAYICTLLLLLENCNNSVINDAKQIINLQLTHDECTGCLDATILNKGFSYPLNIKKLIDDSTSRDIILSGSNPFEYKAGLFQKNYEREYYNVTGYFSGVDSNNAVGKVAVFHIEKSEKFSK